MAALAGDKRPSGAQHPDPVFLANRKHAVTAAISGNQRPIPDAIGLQVERMPATTSDHDPPSDPIHRCASGIDYNDVGGIEFVRQ